MPTLDTCIAACLGQWPYVPSAEETYLDALEAFRRVPEATACVLGMLGALDEKPECAIDLILMVMWIGYKIRLAEEEISQLEAMT